MLATAIPERQPATTRAFAANGCVPYRCRVTERHQENDDTFTLELEPAGVRSHSAFAAGQFNMLYVFGLGEIPISISGDPDQPERLVHTTRAVGTVTRAMAGLRRGDMLGVRGPFGTHWPLEELKGKDIVLVGGGIGLAPLRPALYQLVAQRGDYGRVVLLYGARTPEDMLFRAELERWRSRFDLEIFVTVDRATGDWHGNVGLVTALIPRAPFEPQNAEITFDDRTDLAIEAGDGVNVACAGAHARIKPHRAPECAGQRLPTGVRGSAERRLRPRLPAPARPL